MKVKFRKSIAAMIAMMMLVVILLPIQTIAATKDVSLESAIKIAKSNFSVPKDYTIFESNLWNNNGENVWNLLWRSKDNSGGSINVSIKQDGTIINYNNWKPMPSTYQKKLPKLSRQQAKTAAQAFIKKINPSIASKITYQDSMQAYMPDYTYSFFYFRKENNIPYTNDTVSVDIDKDTGEIRSYNCNWANGLVFPKAENYLTLSQANKTYSEKMGLKLIYKFKMVDNKPSVFLAYVPLYDNNRYVLDALSGNKLEIGSYYGPYFSEGSASMNMQKKDLMMAAGELKLNPEELKAIEEASKILPLEKIDQMARASKQLGLTPDYERVDYSINKDYPINDSYTYNLNFRMKTQDEKTPYKYVNVSMNAITGDLKYFNLDANNDMKAEPKYDFKKAKEAVEAYFKEYMPEMLSQLRYNENNDIQNENTQTDAPRQFWFNYTRVVNGTEFGDNSISVNFDAVDGRVFSFSMNWYIIDFPAVDKVINMSAANTKLFSQIGLKLQYKPVYPKLGQSKLMSPQPTTKPEIKLVYAFDDRKPLIMDALTGTVIDWEGNPYVEYKPVSYTDIKGNLAEKQISILAENGIALDGTTFKPNNAITQKDFLTLLSKTITNYYGPIISKTSTQKDFDELYNIMIREGIIKQAEKAPNAVLTKEQGVKFIIRALKYDKVADIKGIYKSFFKDDSKASPELNGYLTIAAGLKIIQGDSKGYFNPKDKLTRGNAAIMIYNYLSK